jgi:hypothetical protein
MEEQAVEVLPHLELLDLQLFFFQLLHKENLAELEHLIQ